MTVAGLSVGRKVGGEEETRGRRERLSTSNLGVLDAARVRE